MKGSCKTILLFDHRLVATSLESKMAKTRRYSSYMLRAIFLDQFYCGKNKLTESSGDMEGFEEGSSKCT